MANKGIICTVNNVEYSTIRKAMCEGARTIEEIAEKTGICTECEGCRENLEYIITTLCSCKNVSMQTVIDAVQNGADTVDKIVELTEAGSVCGRCKALIQNVIELGR